MASTIVSSPTRWLHFLEEYYQREIDELLVEYPKKKSLWIRYCDVEFFDTELAEELLDFPDISLENAKQALKEFHYGEISLDDAHLRIVGLPKLRSFMVRELRSEHINKLVAVEGLVRKATEVRPKVTKALFRCTKCGHEFHVEQEGNELKEPEKCRNEECDGKRFIFLSKGSKFTNAQKLRIQEAPEELRGGEQPQTIDVELEDDLAGIVNPGDRIVVVGILRIRPRGSQQRRSIFYDLALEGVSIEVREQEFEELEMSEEDIQQIKELAKNPDIDKMIVRSIAPSIYGYDDIKEAIALQLFSGIPKHLPDGTYIRGDIHILLVGDPGIAKSQLLRYVKQLAPRGIYTSGKSTTSAGLTATAVKDEFGDGRWTLEAGALVMADKGIAAVDELDKMDAEDRSALHEAMEQQTISVAKAGILATLKSRCALLGAANPKFGRFDPYSPVAEQINMPPALLSRFDLIFVMQDYPDAEKDSELSSHILTSHYAGELIERSKIDPSVRENLEGVLDIIKPEIPPELLRKYIAYSRRTIFPVMEKEAIELLKEFYVGLRAEGRDEGAPIPVTARQLEALVRIAEASARMRLSDKITVEDARRTIKIVERSLNQVAKDPETGRLDVDILTVGQSKTQRDRVKIVIDIIKELTSEGGMASEKDISAEAQKHGIDDDRVKEILRKLREEGMIYMPTYGNYRLAT